MALTPESLEHYRRILTALRDDLTSGTLRAESQVAEQSDLEHLDPIDRATAGSAKDELLQEAERDTSQLARVEDALQRIEAGTYGTCEVCGKEISKARLDAVPWASLCRADQARQDELAARRHRDSVSQGGAPSRVA